MPEEPENWWETATEERDPDAPAPIAIRGHQAVGGQLLQKPDDGVEPPEGDSTEWSSYSKQKAAATGVFLFTFLVGDWWLDGSNGFGALFQLPTAISDWPQYYPWARDWHPIPGILVLSWMLWDITPAVFLFMFIFGSNIIYAADLDDMKEDSSETRRIGKKAHRNLKYFVSALILMDFLAFSTEGFPILEYPFMFFEIRPGIYWMLIAFGASFGLNPDNERAQAVMKGLTPK